MHPLFRAFSKKIGGIGFKVKKPFGTMKRRFHLVRAQHFGTAKVQAQMCWAAFGVNQLKAHRKLKAMELLQALVRPEGDNAARKGAVGHDKAVWKGTAPFENTVRLSNCVHWWVVQRP